MVTVRDSAGMCRSSFWTLTKLTIPAVTHSSELGSTQNVSFRTSTANLVHPSEIQFCKCLTQPATRILSSMQSQEWIPITCDMPSKIPCSKMLPIASSLRNPCLIMVNSGGGLPHDTCLSWSGRHTSTVMSLTCAISTICSAPVHSQLAVLDGSLSSGCIIY